MFFCEACKNEKNWPGLVPTSYGKCEVCAQRAPCYDVPSKYLPVPEVVWDTLRVHSLAVSLAKTLEYYKLEDPTYNAQVTVDFIMSVLAHNDIEIEDK